MEEGRKGEGVRKVREGGSEVRVSAVFLPLTAPLLACDRRLLIILNLLNSCSSCKWKDDPTTSMRVEPSLRWRGVSDLRTFSLCQWR